MLAVQWLLNGIEWKFNRDLSRISGVHENLTNSLDNILCRNFTPRRHMPKGWSTILIYPDSCSIVPAHLVKWYL